MPALPWQPWAPASCCTRPWKRAAVKATQQHLGSWGRCEQRLASTWIQVIRSHLWHFVLGTAAQRTLFCRRMAAKKKEVVLQINITSQELWEEVLCLKGLIVVDVFQAWCGPCKPVVNLFQKIKNEVGSNLLHFAVAEVDSIDALEKYRGQCEPVFLFYTGGELVAVVRGANAPLLQKTILKQLAGERKGFHGGEPVVVPDRAFSREQEQQRGGLTG
ncbi:thioredoxin domain-containing protein 6 isoform X2 [Serinus canaria]|nr:thioredoxin domain-containing protein 6 isoform X2 [Serinus canaria]